MSPFMDRWPSGKAVDCRSTDPAFESRSVLFSFFLSPRPRAGGKWGGGPRASYSCARRGLTRAGARIAGLRRHDRPAVNNHQHRLPTTWLHCPRAPHARTQQPACSRPLRDVRSGESFLILGGSVRAGRRTLVASADPSALCCAASQSPLRLSRSPAAQRR